MKSFLKNTIENATVNAACSSKFEMFDAEWRNQSVIIYLYKTELLIHKLCVTLFPLLLVHDV